MWLYDCVLQRLSPTLFNPSLRSGGSRVDTTSLTGGTLASDALFAAISWAKMLLLPDVEFPYGAKRKLRWLMLTTPFSSHLHRNEEIKGTCLISKGHNSHPQKKQGSIGGQVLKSDKFGLDFWFFYLLDVWCWTSYLSFQGLSLLIWKMETIIPTLHGCYEN